MADRITHQTKLPENILPNYWQSLADPEAGPGEYLLFLTAIFGLTTKQLLAHFQQTLRFLQDPGVASVNKRVQRRSLRNSNTFIVNHLGK